MSGVPDTFNGYHVWLGIPPAEQPPNHYRLLGITVFEADLDVIDHAADRQMAHVRTFQSGKHGALSQQILNELSAARLCLLTTEKKASYDRELRAKLDSAKPMTAMPVGQAVPRAQSGDAGQDRIAAHGRATAGASDLVRGNRQNDGCHRRTVGRGGPRLRADHARLALDRVIDVVHDAAAASGPPHRLAPVYLLGDFRGDRHAFAGGDLLRGRAGANAELAGVVGGIGSARIPAVGLPRVDLRFAGARG